MTSTKKMEQALMSAVVHLGGGTGEFVSHNGLILTNHHVAFGALQRASTKEKDYIKKGFIAWSKDEEIPAKGYNLIYADFSTDKSHLIRHKLWFHKFNKL